MSRSPVHGSTMPGGDPAAMAALRHPTAAEKEEEKRLYFVLRRDFPVSAGSLTRLAARITWQTLAAALDGQAPRYLGYDPATQPKIVLRARDIRQLERAIQETSGFPQAIAAAPDGSPLFLGLGPACRAELAPFVRKLQMLSDETPADAAEIAAMPPGFSGSVLWLFVRADARIPYGKLAAQAGHGAFGVLSDLARSTPWLIAEWVADGAHVATKIVPDLETLNDVYASARDEALPASFIVDAGRTVFAEPTPTIVGVGPSAAARLPRSVLALPDLV